MEKTIREINMEATEDFQKFIQENEELLTKQVEATGNVTIPSQVFFAITNFIGESTRTLDAIDESIEELKTALEKIQDVVVGQKTKTLSASKILISQLGEMNIRGEI